MKEISLDALKELLAADKPKPMPRCAYRKCRSDGEYFLQRRVRLGTAKGTPINFAYIPGFFCDRHERQFGETNLMRAAQDAGMDVGWLEDEEGSFRGLVPREKRKYNRTPLLLC